jgi:hypothetical protein
MDSIKQVDNKLQKLEIKKKPINLPITDNSSASKKKLNKQKLGQFFTTNYKYILDGMVIPDNIKNVIEPFTGNGDLLKFLTPNKYALECYDIDPKHDYITKRDTITNPPDYKDKFILTNPPYLARNKSGSDEKAAFDKYGVNDLYKCFMKEITVNKCLGGIVIIPLNFWSSIRNGDIALRQVFLEVYSITRLNIFEERVFDDTTYTVCALQFTRKNDLIQTTPNSNTSNIIDTWIFPSKANIQSNLDDNNNYLIGGDIYKLPTAGKYKITRATSTNVAKLNTNILVKCIDDNANSQIGLSYVATTEDLYIDNTPNQSSRTYATLIITPAISQDQQRALVEKFNTFLAEQRKKYHSLFLTNYRESKDIARKRISFDLVYSIVEYLLDLGV